MMQSLIRSAALAATLVGTGEIRAAAPLFHQAFSIEAKNLELKALNNAGDVLVTITDPDQPRSDRAVPAIVRDGSILKLQPALSQELIGVYANGLSERRADGAVFVAGNAVFQNGFFRAAVWQVAVDGSFTFKVAPNIVLPEDSLAPGEQPRGYGRAVNTSGVMVGQGSSHLAGVATVWRPPYERAVRYLLSTGSSFDAIAENGLLLANGVEFEHGTSRNRYAAAVLFEGGPPTEVPLLDEKVTTYWPNSANDMSGEWVTGFAHIGDTTRAFAWKIGTASSINLPNPPEHPAALDTDGWSVNSSGDVIGLLTRGPGWGQLILWENSNGAHEAQRFGRLIPDDPQFNVQVSKALINDDDQVAVLVRNWASSSLRFYNPLTDGLIQLVYTSAYASEDEGQIVFPVRLLRVPGNTSPVTLRVRTSDGTAQASTHYSAVDTMVSWAAGESGEKTVTIPLSDNDAFDPAIRTFKFELVSATGAQLGGVREAEGTIMDDSSTVRVRNLTFLESSFMNGVAVIQGQPSVQVQLERSGGRDGALTISNFRFNDQSARAGLDYIAPTLPALTWARGETGVKTVTIPLINNSGTDKETKTFWMMADIQLEGSPFPDSLGTTIMILAISERPPATVSQFSLNQARTALNVEVVAPQGSVVQLMKANDVDGSWSPAAEQRVSEATTRFTVPIPSTSGKGFFQARVKP